MLIASRPRSRAAPGGSCSAWEALVADPASSLRIDGHPDDHIIYLTGTLDMATAPQLQAALHQVIDAGEQHITLDLANLSFCDSTGLGVFIATHLKLPGGLSLRNPTPQLQALLHITALDTQFPRN